MPQVNVLGPLLFLLYTLEIFSILRNKPSPGVRVTVEEFLNRDHGKVIEWCDLWDEIEYQ